MHRYYDPKLNHLSPSLIVAVWAALILLLSVALYERDSHHAPGEIHALPDPYRQECQNDEGCEQAPLQALSIDKRRARA